MESCRELSGTAAHKTQKLSGTALKLSGTAQKLSGALEKLSGAFGNCRTQTQKLSGSAPKLGVFTTHKFEAVGKLSGAVGNCRLKVYKLSGAESCLQPPPKTKAVGNCLKAVGNSKAVGAAVNSWNCSISDRSHKLGAVMNCHSKSCQDAQNCQELSVGHGSLAIALR